MSGVEIRTAKRTPNVGAQGGAETPVRRNDGGVVRPEGGEYSATNEPLSEGILENVNNQIAFLEIFTFLFHNIAVIGLRNKCKT